MKIITLVSLTTLALAFTACNKQEAARKAEIEAKADKLEDAAKATENGAKADADVVKKQGAANAEALKAEADRTREQK
jgi:lipopolysaccharide export system protein LptA